MIDTALDIIVNKILFWLLATLIFLQAWVIVFHGGIPNIRTAPAIRKKLITLLKDDFNKRGKKSYTVIDLGSGNGLLTREIARALPEAHIIGLELAKTSLLWANMMKGLTGLKNITYLQKNFLTYDFSEADALLMYLLPPVMQKLGEKFHKETKPGTFISSNKFRLGDGWEPDEVLFIKSIYFHQGDVFLYRKK